MSDADQLKLDLEDAKLRLDRLRQAIQRRDDAEAHVKSLEQQLRQARRKAKEAGWDLASLINQERQGKKGG